MAISVHEIGNYELAEPVGVQLLARLCRLALKCVL